MCFNRRLLCKNLFDGFVSRNETLSFWKLDIINFAMSYSVNDVAFGKFYGFPLWPVRIIGITASKKGKSDQVFCSGSHEKATLS